MSLTGLLKSLNGSSHRLDRSSGLVFNETEMVRIDNSWHRRCKGRLSGKKSGINQGPGTSSLYETVLHKFVKLRHHLDSSEIGLIPFNVIEPIWNYLRSHDLVSLEVWKTFAVAYSGNELIDDAHLRHFRFNAHMFIKSGTWAHSLTPVISPCKCVVSSLRPPSCQTEAPKEGQVETSKLPFSPSPRIEFLTFLEITNVTATRLDILFLSEIRNLGSLSLGPRLRILPNQHGIDDGIVRSWCSPASIDDALPFQALRCMELREQNLLTTFSMTYLSELPALARLGIRHSFGKYFDDFVSKIPDYGWVYEYTGEAGAWQDQPSPYITGKDAVQLSRQAHFTYLTSSFSHYQHNSHEAERIDGLPVLHFQLAGHDMDGGWQLATLFQNWHYFTRQQSNKIDASDHGGTEEAGEESVLEVQNRQRGRKNWDESSDESEKTNKKPRKTKDVNDTLAEMGIGLS